MTLYELLKEISDILTPNDNAFFDYAIYTSDDNGGFLRTRYCWWKDRPILDKNIGEVYETVLVTSKNKINTADLKDESNTLVKMQITYSNPNAAQNDAEWDITLDYCYVYIFNLKAQTYTMTYMKKPCA